jgi:hypothetical protein
LLDDGLWVAARRFQTGSSCKTIRSHRARAASRVVQMPTASFQRHDQHGEIVINNPPTNLFSGELIVDLRNSVDQAAGAEVRAVLLRANGPAFTNQ